MKPAYTFFGIAMLSLAALAALGGCESSGGTGSGSCALSVPASCPTSAPSYATDVAPLVQTYCASCHAAGGQEADRPLDTFASLSGQINQVQSEIASCGMPPANGAQPTSAEMQVILDWIACGAQNN